MWAFHGNFWAKGDTFHGTSYLKAHPLKNRCPERGNPTYTRNVDRIQTRALGDPSDPKANIVPLDHGGLLFFSTFFLPLKRKELTKTWRELPSGQHHLKPSPPALTHRLEPGESEAVGRRFHSPTGKVESASSMLPKHFPGYYRLHTGLEHCRFLPLTPAEGRGETQAKKN
ncbi:hypothetical protein E2C01_000124 [Portunus trituberculatus]|uniref:Uncharacterized protein n=1 Tax=Portunus trituberculatus TaxID=210409 RepID=A0A5B7CEC1_PORTR|nr:hypothetical protein [Portunus trituberculatus]